VTLHWADFAWIVAIVVAGCAASYGLAMRKARHAIAESHREMERRLQALTEAVAMQEPYLAEPVPSTDALDATEMEAEPAFPRIEIPKEPAPAESEEIGPEIQAAIAAAAIAMLGNHARVREARRVPSQDVVSPWTQQGRVIVQASHNLRARGR
jgi:hypothetical protein